MTGKQGNSQVAIEREVLDHLRSHDGLRPTDVVRNLSHHDRDDVGRALGYLLDVGKIQISGRAVLTPLARTGRGRFLT